MYCITAILHSPHDPCTQSTTIHFTRSCIYIVPGVVYHLALQFISSHLTAASLPRTYAATTGGSLSKGVVAPLLQSLRLSSLPLSQSVLCGCCR